MKRLVFFLLALCLLTCCRHSPKELSKLDRLHQIAPDSVIPFFDLSGDSLAEFPDLSSYTIDSLDLSHNKLDSLVVRYFPKGIKWLDVSYNCLGDTFFYEELEDTYSLKKVDLSHNRIRVVGDAWWWLASMKTSRGDSFEDLLYLQNASDVSGLWVLLEMPTDSVSSFGDYNERIAELDKHVITFGRYIY